jgi:hypothetical protein
LKLKNEEEMTNIINKLTIDQVLNLPDAQQDLRRKRQQTLLSSNSSPAAAAASLLQQRKQQQFSNVTPLKSSLIRNDSSLSSSFDSEHNTSMPNMNLNTNSQSIIDEHKLKLLESNFDQIAMAYHSDKHQIQSSIDTFTERFKRADTEMVSLFATINDSLNKAVNCLNENNSSSNRNNDTSLLRASWRANKYNRKSSQCSTENPLDELAAPLDLIEDSETSSLLITKKDKKCMQEHLNVINKALIQLRKNVCCLVANSSVVSGLKQVIQSFSSFFI